jgi:IclR family transcriptional regulator, acetate operon repressor
VQQRAEKHPSSRPLLTLQRGLKILEAVAEQPGRITAKELSANLAIRPGVCYHLLRTLEEGGYVVRLPRGKYDLNGRVSFLQDTFRSRLTPDLGVLTILRDLHEQVDETTAICGWHGQRIVVQWYLEPRRALHARSLEIGYEGNSHARASTRAILAYLTEVEVRAYFACSSRPKLTPNTLTEIDELVEELKRIARVGYAVDREELSRGVCCVGAAYFDERGFPVGAYGVSVPTDRFDEADDGLIQAVSKAANMASATLGYSGRLPPPSALLSPEAAGRRNGTSP